MLSLFRTETIFETEKFLVGGENHLSPHSVFRVQTAICAISQWEKIITAKFRQCKSMSPIQSFFNSKYQMLIRRDPTLDPISNNTVANACSSTRDILCTERSSFSVTALLSVVTILEASCDCVREEGKYPVGCSWAAPQQGSNWFFGCWVCFVVVVVFWGVFLLSFLVCF